MDNYFKILCELFNAEYYDNYEMSNDNGDWTDETFQVIYKEIGISVASKTNPMEIILTHIYLNDSISLLERMLSTEETVGAKIHFGFDYEIDEVFTEFVRGDWSDYPDTDYGEEGHNYYEIHTKNYIHIFSKMMPFGEHFTLCGSDKKNNN